MQLVNVCQDLLNEPKILPCLHSFCTGCLKEWSGRLANLDPSKCHLECPLCTAKVLSTSCAVAIEELPSHFSAICLVEIVQLQEQAGTKKVMIMPICQHCNDNKNAISSYSEYCIFLCEFCEKAYKKAKIMKERKIFLLDEMRKGTCLHVYQDVLAMKRSMLERRDKLREEKMKTMQA